MDLKAGALEKGMYILMKQVPHRITEREFVNPGKGSAFVRLKLSNAKTGAALRETIKSQENVEVVEIQEATAQYLYSENGKLHFMDNSSFEQFEVPETVAQDQLPFVKEGDTYKVILWGSEALEVIIPTKMVFQVIDAEVSIKGDTVTNAVKNVTLETGTVVKAPLFIKAGEKILVNTETKEYVERVNS